MQNEMAGKISLNMQLGKNNSKTIDSDRADLPDNESSSCDISDLDGDILHDNKPVD